MNVQNMPNPFFSAKNENISEDILIIARRKNTSAQIS